MSELLALDQVRAGYGDTVVLEEVSLGLARGGTMALLGRNGVGKTTLLATVMGHTTLHAGAILFDGGDITSLAIHQRSRAGIGYVPQEREIFPSLTVAENLEIAARPGPWTAARVYDLFPHLRARRGNLGNQLSGGEQQMLAVARALVGNPALILMDEPLEGLAPVIVDQLVAALEALRGDQGLAIVLVEQHARLALDLCRQALVLDRGRVVYDGESGALLDDPGLLDALIGVRGSASASNSASAPR